MATQYLVHLSLTYFLVSISNLCKLSALSSNHSCVCDFVFIYNCAFTVFYLFEFATTALLMVLNVHIIQPNTIQVSGYIHRDSLPNVTYQSLLYVLTIMSTPTLYSFTIQWCYISYCAFPTLFLSYCTLKSLLETSHYNTFIVWPDCNKTCYFEILKSNESFYSEYHLLNTNNNSQSQKYDNLVVNLSDQTLTDDQTKLLSRGLKFCPNPGEPDFKEYTDDLDSFHLRLKRQLHFRAVSDSDSDSEQTILRPTPQRDPLEPFGDQSFKLPSDWVPPVNAPLEYFIQQNELTLNRTKVSKYLKQNITNGEKQAFKLLTSNKSITIKPADKGGAVVVLNTTDYINEGLRQLSDTKFYQETATDLTAQHSLAVTEKIKQMYENKEIDLHCHDYLLHIKGRTSLFYMLPKIHKKKENPPGRPIVSGNGCPTEKISQLVDFFLQPHVKLLPSYIKDTTHFLLKLNQLGNLPPNTILATLDVASLYTNIPNTEGLEAARLALHRMRGRMCNPSNESLTELLKMVLTMNNFDFAGRHYLQVGGTAMGTKVAPSFANTFMGWFENIYVYTYHKQPHLWVRFIDDIFVIWTEGPQQLDLFVDYLNNCLPSIKFEAETSLSSVNFLDVKVKLSPEGCLTTGLYTKPTDAHNYLSYSSCHPPKCRDSIPYSQFLRLRRICSDTLDFTNEARTMASHFHRAGYPKKLLQDSFTKTYQLNREELLEYKQTYEREKDERNLFLINTFHPSGNVLDNIIKMNWDMLDRSSATRPLLEYKITRGYRRPKNCRDTLIRAMTSNPWDVQSAPKAKDPTDNPDLRACSRRNCKYCNKINTGGRLHCPITDLSYSSIRKANCESNNLIYCITCESCQKMYVGQTKRSIRSRLCEHFRNVVQNNTTVHSVGRHFNEQGHNGLEDVRIFVLQFARGHPDSDVSLNMRLDLEQKWICTLRTKIPDGLNVFNNKKKPIKNKTR